MMVLEAEAVAAAPAVDVDHVFGVTSAVNQDIIVELCEKHGLKYVYADHETQLADVSALQVYAAPLEKSWVV